MFITEKLSELSKSRLFFGLLAAGWV